MLQQMGMRCGAEALTNVTATPYLLRIIYKIILYIRLLQ